MSTRLVPVLAVAASLVFGAATSAAPQGRFAAPRTPWGDPDLQGSYPPYFIYGPVVFSVASQQLLSAAGRGAMANMFGSPLFNRILDAPSFPGEELVVVPSPFLPHRLAKGYDSPQGAVVKTINGVAVKNLRHAVELLRDAKGEFITIDFDRRGGEAIVFSRKELDAATEDLLTDSGIRSQGTPELMKVWNTRGAAR